MIDLHTHVLPGIDDGTRSMTDAVALVSAMAREGVTALAATPHVRDDYPTTPERMRAGTELLRAELDARGLEVEIIDGGEVALERLASGDDRAFALNGTRYLLVEFPDVDWPLTLSTTLGALLREGIRPVVAHPERNPSVQAAPARLSTLVEQGVVLQVTAAAVLGTFGTAARDTALELVESGLAHVLASDAHGPGHRRPSLASAVAALPDPALAQWLTETVPAAILADAPELPPRPAPAGRRSRRWWHRAR